MSERKGMAVITIDLDTGEVERQHCGPDGHVLVFGAGVYLSDQRTHPTGTVELVLKRAKALPCDNQTLREGTS